MSEDAQEPSSLEIAAEDPEEDRLFQDYYDHRLDYWIWVQTRLREDVKVRLAARA